MTSLRNNILRKKNAFTKTSVSLAICCRFFGVEFFSFNYRRPSHKLIENNLGELSLKDEEIGLTWSVDSYNDKALRALLLVSSFLQGC